MSYIPYLIIQVEILAMVALALNLIVSAGLVHAGIAGFYGIGAFTLALVLKRADPGFPVLLAVAGLMTAVCSLGVSIPSWKFRGQSFVMVSLAAQVCIYSLLYNLTDITGGPFGVGGIQKPHLFGVVLGSGRAIAVLYGLFLALLLMFLLGLLSSSFGRNIKAIRNDELAACSLGIPVRRMKTQVILIASAIVGIAGGLYASVASYIDPSLFTLDESILMLSMVIIGGAGNVKGPFVGALVLVGIPEVLRTLPIPSSAIGSLRMIIFGLLLITIVRVRPQGLAGKYRLE